jgi:hypothetical protein
VTSAQRTRAELIADTAIEVLAGQGMRGLTHRAVDLAAGLPIGSTSNHARTRAALLRTALARITELEAAELAATMSFGSSSPSGEGDDARNGDSGVEYAGSTAETELGSAIVASRRGGSRNRSAKPEQPPSAPTLTAVPKPAAAATPTANSSLSRTTSRIAGATPAPIGPASSSSATAATAVIDEFADGVAMVLHRGLTHGRVRLLARYEFALESTRRPDLRALYDEAGRPFRDPAAALLAALGSPDPDRHARMLIVWCEGVQFDSLAGAGSVSPPDLAELQADLRQLLRGMISHNAAS